MLNWVGVPHNSGEPVTVVPALKRYVRNSKATYDNKKQQRRRTDSLRETLHDRWTDGFPGLWVLWVVVMF